MFRATSVLPLLLCGGGVAVGQDRPIDYLQSAKEAARWISASRIDKSVGVTWPVEPAKPDRASLTLYQGSPGVVWFFSELYKVTNERTYLEDAKSGAGYLISQLPPEKEGINAGFYTGWAGVGFVLDAVYRASGERKYRRAEQQCVERIVNAAKPNGAGVSWSASYDIISGSSGTGLYLLDAARRHDNKEARQTAIRAGRRLVEAGRPARGGLKWPISEQYTRLMPNFSHGTAGVCYFLVELYAETNDKRFLDAALAGAKYLESVAKNDRQGFRVFHHEPGGEELFYLGWCHGPVGTSRLFYRLHQVTGDARWRDRLHATTRTLLQSPLPERQTPGYWNNVGQCCGAAGVAEFFLSRHRLLGKDAADLAFSERVVRHVARQAEKGGNGWKWTHAEHRVQPENLTAQTGYMQGAAGIGMLFLRMDAWRNRREPLVRLPDDPWAWE